MLLLIAKAIIISAILIFSFMGGRMTVNQPPINNPLPSISPMPTYIPTVEPEIKKVKGEKTYIRQPTVDSDPEVNCQISKECGGGSFKLRSNACKNTVCCKIGGKWQFYYSIEQCKKDQATEKAYYDQVLKQMKDANNQLTNQMNNFNNAPTYSPIPQTNTSTSNSQTNISSGPSQQEIQNCLNRVSAVGAGDSSVAERCYTSPGSVPPAATNCYSSWDEYFKAHPGYTGNIAGLGNTPPCD